MLQLFSWFLLAVCHLGVIVWTLQNPIMPRVACVDMCFVVELLYSNREVRASRFYSPDDSSTLQHATDMEVPHYILNSNHYQQMLDYSWCYIGLPDATPPRPSSMILSYDPVKQQHIPQPGSAWGDWSLYTDSPLRAFENETGVTWQEIFTWWW